jgi:hypothetical protein
VFTGKNPYATKLKPQEKRMPRERQVEETSPSTALAIPDDIRADLLRAQQDSIETPQALPRVKIMAAGAGLFEFEDTSDTTRTFKGVVLANHPRNVCWDKKFGEQAATAEESLPACSSNDGRTGLPREGFAHAGLPSGVVGNGVRTVACRTCPYNQWNSGNMLISDKNPRGKACTNQRSVFVLVEDREAPVELVLPPTNISGFDEYLTTLLNRGIPVQAVVTDFRQEVVRMNGFLVGKALFSMDKNLTQDEFNIVLGKRLQYQTAMIPNLAVASLPEESESFDDEYVRDTGEELPF